MPYDKKANENYSVSVSSGIGKISFNLNINWFMKIAEEEDYVLIELDTESIGEYENPIVDNPNHEFWVLCENKITKVLEDGASMELHGEYAAECYENAIFQTLLEDPEFHDEFKKYYFTKDQFDYIEEYTDLMAELDTGDIIKHFIHLKDVEVERLHDGRWGVKSIEDRNLLRENVGDWFINQFVVLITDYPHVQLEEDFKRVATEMTGGNAKISVNF